MQYKQKILKAKNADTYMQIEAFKKASTIAAFSAGEIVLKFSEAALVTRK
jgi:hypothetical protein